MKPILQNKLFILILLCLSFRNSLPAQDVGADPEGLKDLCMSLLSKSDYKLTLTHAVALKEIGRQRESPRYEMYADICLGQSLLMTGREDSARYHLDHSLLLATRLKNDSALCSVYNGLGLYAANAKMDYYGAITYFFEGLQAAKRSSYERLHTILLLNLAAIYYLKEDPVGLKYSLECYEIGHRKDDPYLIYTASANVASMYYLIGDYAQALKYIKEAEGLMLQHGFYDQSKIYNRHGNILFALGRDDEATANFEKALQHIGHAQASSVSDTYRSYANVLIKRGNYKEAISHLRKSLEWSQSQKNVIYRQQAIKRLSEVYEAIGDDTQALTLYKQYHIVSDSIFNINKERSLNELRIQFDLQSHEEKTRKQELIIQAKHRQLQTSAFLVLISLVFAVLIYLAYRRKNKLYTRIVEQNREAIRREEALKLQIEQLKTGSGKEETAEKYSVSSLSDEKSRQLFVELEKLMNEQRIYRECELTKENIAEMLQTNRTYLSQAVNQQTGLSVTHYINSFRINEAIRILSDAANTTPLKILASELGFSSVNTFYKSFQAMVGMPPSTYRKKATELHRSTRARD